LALAACCVALCTSSAHAQHIVRAPTDGVVEKIMFKEGDFVEGGKLMVIIQ
jgi:hypothetical protein